MLQAAKGTKNKQDRDAQLKQALQVLKGLYHRK